MATTALRSLYQKVLSEQKNWRKLEIDSIRISVQIGAPFRLKLRTLMSLKSQYKIARPLPAPEITAAEVDQRFSGRVVRWPMNHDGLIGDGCAADAGLAPGQAGCIVGLQHDCSGIVWYKLIVAFK